MCNFLFHIDKIGINIEPIGIIGMEVVLFFEFLFM